MDPKDFVEQFNKDWTEFKKTNDELVKAKADGKSVAELEQKLGKINESLDTLESLNQKMARIETAMKRVPMAESKSGIQLSDAQIEHKQAFEQWARKGKGETDGSLAALEKKAFQVSDDTQGGFMVHADLNGRIVQRIFETSPIRQFAAVTTISTDALEGPNDFDEATTGWVAETGVRAVTANPKIGQWRIPTHEIFTQPAATQKLLDDAVWDLESWLMKKIADKFARTENAAFVNGTGVGQPRGFLTQTIVANSSVTDDSFAAGKKIGYIPSGAAGDFIAVPTSSAPTSQANPLVDCVFAMKSEYRNRPGTAWAMPRAMFGRIRKLQDAFGQYIWMPGLAGQPSTLLGYPVAEFNDMPAMAANSYSIAFANWAEAYQIVDRIGIRVLRDPYTSKPNTLFYTTKRVGGDLLNADAIKLIKFAAS